MKRSAGLRCGVCGHFLAEIGDFARVRCCGYEFIARDLRAEKRRAEQVLRVLNASPVWRRLEKIIDPYLAQGLEAQAALDAALRDGQIDAQQYEDEIRPVLRQLVGRIPIAPAGR